MRGWYFAASWQRGSNQHRKVAAAITYSMWRNGESSERHQKSETRKTAKKKKRNGVAARQRKENKHLYVTRHAWQQREKAAATSVTKSAAWRHSAIGSRQAAACENIDIKHGILSGNKRQALGDVLNGLAYIENQQLENRAAATYSVTGSMRKSSWRVYGVRSIVSVS